MSDPISRPSQNKKDYLVRRKIEWYVKEVMAYQLRQRGDDNDYHIRTYTNLIDAEREAQRTNDAWKGTK